MADRFPAPDQRHPIILGDGTPHEGTVFLKPVIDHPRWQVGDYSYASAFHPPGDWAAHLAPYLFEFAPERLVIGKFCQIADGVRFITSSANHRYDGISSFPFAVFDGTWDRDRASMPEPGADTVVGHDVWIGQGATILPGARIGSGVIIGSGSVVGGTIPDYAIVSGNPGTVRRLRFSERDVAELLRIAWWDWPVETILAHEAEICGGDVAALSALG